MPCVACIARISWNLNYGVTAIQRREREVDTIITAERIDGCMLIAGRLLVVATSVWRSSWSNRVSIQIIYAVNGFTRITLPEDKQHISRRSLAVYFYTKDRPPEETAHPHGTVYVPRPLPAHLESGYTLQQADVDTLAILTERRNAQIRFLYERELEFSETITGITGSLSCRLGRALTWPLRRLRGRNRHR